MRRPLPAVVPVLTAVAVSLVLTLSGSASVAAKPKHPDHASVTDKRGDAPAGIDLLSGTYSITRKKAVWSVRLARLTETTFVAFESWPLNSAWDRIAVFREGGKTVGRVYFVDNEEETTPYLRKCPGLKITWKPSKAKVRVVVPRGCMQASLPGYGPYEFRVFSRFGGSRGGPGDTMRVKTLDVAGR
ncbi:MAG TPA: hypothetical protein DEQ43_11005 [Nocardioides bacterium]|uniref:hypothetical protein n=1 Tax=uncultured Nocardioides sp. TaxID=198441 RepID=UPI000EF0B220|nr:hypothetical protein [uncultured Nocardioides sp.]HCB04755.1 hypothetical protein [Nocardioides sp.]